MEVTLHGDTEPHEGYFSFVMYWRSDTSFERTKYFRGLQAYLQILETPFFANVGMLIYTDDQSLPILQAVLKGPKLTFLTVRWPEYTYEGVLDGGILRCARFQATQQFPDAWIACRDADTLFPKATKEEGFVANLAAWEEAFLQGWRSRGLTEIVLGVNPEYQQEWHRNMLFPNLYRRVNKTTSLLRVQAIQQQLRKQGLSKEEGPIFFAPLGIYAGFANFPPGLSFWPLCEAYLQQRFFVIPGIGLSNQESVIRAIGKDERLLLFVLLPMFHERVFYYTLVYEDEETEPLMLDAEYPPKVFVNTIHSNLDYDDYATQKKYKEIFGEFLTTYMRWIATDPSVYEDRYRQIVSAIHLNKDPATLFHPKRATRKRKNRRTTRKRKNKN